MAPLPTIPNIHRVTLNFNQVNGVSPRNVFHVDGGTHTVQEVGLQLRACFTSSGAGLFEIVPTAYQFSDISIIPLDGHSATYNQALSAPVTGGAGGTQGSPATAAVLSMHTNQRGPRGRGRLYIGPCSENFIADGVMDATKRTNMVATWTNFKSALFQGTTPLVLVVASYVHSQANSVNSLSMNLICGTQRRRQDQLR
jgi:hypothetical protein